MSKIKILVQHLLEEGYICIYIHQHTAYSTDSSCNAQSLVGYK